MTRKFTGLLTLVLVVHVSLAAQDAKPVLQVASKAIGDVRSIQYSGTATYTRWDRHIAPLRHGRKTILRATRARLTTARALQEKS
jgi:hypothetical protein